MDLTSWLGAEARSGEVIAARRARNLISGAYLSCGVVLGFVVLLIMPGWDVAHRLPLTILAVALAGGSLLQLVFAAQTPVAMNHATSVVGSAAIAATQALVGDPVAVSTMGLLYVWIAVITALYYSVRATAVHMAVVTAAQVAVVVWLQSTAMIPQVVLTVGTCVTAAAIVSWLTRTLRRQLLTDPLTNLTNRRGLDAIFAHDLAVAARSGRPLCVAVLDLDDFKQLNDRHGHAAGDAALLAAAQEWQRVLRPTDTLARIGGDEFVVVLPDCDGVSAEHVISRLLASTPNDLRCSAGIAVYRRGEDADGFMARADAAMYRAKAREGTALVMGNDVLVIGNDVSVIGNDEPVIGNDVSVIGNEVHPAR